MTAKADQVIPPLPYPRHCEVIRVVDGDTMHLAVDLGCDTTVSMTVRCAGINAPDFPDREAQHAATVFAQDWITENGPIFELRTIRDKREKFGRYLADLLPLDNSKMSLCQAMLSSGHAVEYWP